MSAEATELHPFSAWALRLEISVDRDGTTTGPYHITGTAWDYDTAIVVEAHDWPLGMSQHSARVCLRAAVEDGRCKVPDSVRARLADGKVVLR